MKEDARIKIVAQSYFGINWKESVDLNKRECEDIMTYSARRFCWGEKWKWDFTSNLLFFGNSNMHVEINVC